MNVQVRVGLGGGAAVALMVAALWAWQQSGHLSIDAEQPKVMFWAVRTAAVSAASLAQAVTLLAVVGNLYAARPVEVVLRVLSSGLFLLAGASALVLGLAAR